jgi:tryptophanyl-tRNA synthetase
MRFLSGVQPSGELHLGNYFGAIKQQIALQNQGEAYYFIANFHALTTLRDPDRLRELATDVAITYLSLGLDPQKAVLFRQSDVPEVLELSWVLGSVTGMGLLERAVSYKDKVEKGIKPSIGLFTYPVLMAADILIYKPDFVPVGADQVQHIEMCNDMAGHFHSYYKKGLFKRCEAKLSSTPRVPGLDGEKMSKSYGNTIPIFLEGKKLKKLLGRIVTDSTDYTQEALKHEGCNVYDLYTLFATAEELGEMRRRYIEDRDFGYGHAKMALKAKMDEYFSEAREKRKEFLAHPEKVEAILKDGAARARKVARETLIEVREACGIHVVKD